MPYTGYDPYETGRPIDVSGGGYDPSAYYGLSPGGRFPGDVQNFLDYLIAQSRGTAGGNPDYAVPDWAKNLPGTGGNAIRRLLGAHERNVRNGGEGQSPNLPVGQPHNFFSGPGASYGPQGGPLHGAVDIDRPGIWDGPENPGLGRVEPGGNSGGGRNGGGGDGTGKLSPFQPYQGLKFEPQFVSMSPLRYGQSSPTMTPGASSLYGMPYRAPAPQGRGAGTNNGRGSGPGTNTGRGTGSGRGQGRGVGVTGQTGGTNRTPGQTAPGDIESFISQLLELGPGRATDSRMTAQDLRSQMFGGIDAGNLDRGTPSWLLDPTTRIGTAGGFPNPTPRAPGQGQSFNDYINTLSDQGLSVESIANLLSGYGFQGGGRPAGSGPPDPWSWGWGAGPVVRGENGYEFARQNRGDGGGFRETPQTVADPRVWDVVTRR